MIISSDLTPDLLAHDSLVGEIGSLIDRAAEAIGWSTLGLPLFLLAQLSSFRLRVPTPGKLDTRTLVSRLSNPK